MYFFLFQVTVLGSSPGGEMTEPDLLVQHRVSFGCAADYRGHECLADLAAEFPDFLYAVLPRGPNRVGLAAGGEYLARLRLDAAAVSAAAAAVSRRQSRDGGKINQGAQVCSPVAGRLFSGVLSVVLCAFIILCFCICT